MSGGVDMMVAMNPQTWDRDLAEIEAWRMALPSQRSIGVTWMSSPWMVRRLLGLLCCHSLARAIMYKQVSRATNTLPARNPAARAPRVQRRRGGPPQHYRPGIGVADYAVS